MKTRTAERPPMQQDLAINEHRPLRLASACGRQVDCLGGSLWISVAGLAQDFHIRAGQSFTVPSNALVLVGTLDKSAAQARITGPATQAGVLQRAVKQGLARLWLHNGGRAEPEAAIPSTCARAAA
ncbi:MAG: DUF2917 domain-containing protein [Janthinobacterium lividum]